MGAVLLFRGLGYSRVVVRGIEERFFICNTLFFVFFSVMIFIFFSRYLRVVVLV